MGKKGFLKRTLKLDPKTAPLWAPFWDPFGVTLEPKASPWRLLEVDEGSMSRRAPQNCVRRPPKYHFGDVSAPLLRTLFLSPTLRRFAASTLSTLQQGVRYASDLLPVLQDLLRLFYKDCRVFITFFHFLEDHLRIRFLCCSI